MTIKPSIDPVKGTLFKIGRKPRRDKGKTQKRPSHEDS